MSGKPDGDDKRADERRRLIDLTRRDKGLPERRRLGIDRRKRRLEGPSVPGDDGAPGAPGASGADPAPDDAAE
ncbi:MAG: hypothetical protein QOF57_522 [Frankiaceae bacterium]|nr:hypothetical protein [Frankiaceae bacterium]